MKRKERESNSQGSSLDCFRDSCHRPLACPSVIELRRQESNLRRARLTVACPYQHGPHRNRVGTVGFEPTISCFRSTRNCQLSHTPNARAPSGNRTRTSAMARQQAAATSWALAVVIIKLSKNKSTGPDSNRRRRITGAESWPLDDQCFVVSGTRGTRTLTSPVKSRGCCR